MLQQHLLNELYNVLFRFCMKYWCICMQQLTYKSSLINTKLYTLSLHRIPPDTHFMILLLDAMHPLTSDESSIKSWQKNDFKCLQTWKKVKHMDIAYMQNYFTDVCISLYHKPYFFFFSTCCLLGWEDLNYIFGIAGCGSCISRSINWGPIASLNNPILEQDLKSSEQSNQLVFGGWGREYVFLWVIT